MSRKRGTHCAGGCGLERELGPNFYVGSDGHPRQKCKRCMSKDNEAWRRANPEKHKRAYQVRNHRSNLKTRFGMSVEEYNVLVAQSDGVCGICREPESRERKLCLDHDHQTGALRGFLCSRCNLLLGNASDSVELLKQAIRYLRSEGNLRTSVEPPPVPMLLFCPTCGKQHLDKGAFAHRLHATHACQHCGMVWRPAIVRTVGVQFLPGYRTHEVVNGICIVCNVMPCEFEGQTE